MTAGVLAPPRRTPVAWAPAANALAVMDAAKAIRLGVLPGPGWVRASKLTEPEGLDLLLQAAARRWNAAPHAAATLAWKSYSYWASLPTVLSWAAARRVPLLTADTTYAQFHDEAPFLTIGTAPAPFAVLPSDTLAGTPGTVVVADEDELLATLRTQLLERHLDPLLDAIRTEVRVGRRTLLGSVASGIAYGMIRASDALPGSTHESLLRLLTALELDDLVDVCASDSGMSVQRKTCCLAFTLDQPKICSGCCIRP
ncbi:hypothetical protein HDA40_004684 [Hamadaea flava]|uniref:Ferric iron reductase FhuF-like transporter n=1 Tax=Hamadaea flava TaxID=1742688 RepID=A0ABV8LG14_9ACTN|nr:hypothetical protein [Hamadaea flava]MCP2326177.1 hypothetical protein [Hamadaea flava]